MRNKSLELGKKSEYISQYDPDKLFPIARQTKREEIGIVSSQLPFYGFDAWNHYEVSWLNAKGKPMVALAEVIYDCTSPNIIESKSFKLYFNSFNNTIFDSTEVVENTIQKDIEAGIGAPVFVRVVPLGQGQLAPLQESFDGECIDVLDIACSCYQVNASLLLVEDLEVEETLYSDLLKSNCLVTYQPDWGSVQITYKGPKINREALLQYIVSFRNHNEFHEQCIERIFVDILKQCKPSELTVYGRYTRRGGVDINPYRSTIQPEMLSQNIRLVRQ